MRFIEVRIPKAVLYLTLAEYEAAIKRGQGVHPPAEAEGTAGAAGGSPEMSNGYRPRAETAAVLDRAYELVRSVPYQVTARWLFYRLLQEGAYADKDTYGTKFLPMLAKARKRFYRGWHPDTLADDTREAVIFFKGVPPLSAITRECPPCKAYNPFGFPPSSANGRHFPLLWQYIGSTKKQEPFEWLRKPSGLWVLREASAAWKIDQANVKEGRIKPITCPI